MSEPTYWNGERCSARKVTVIVADDGSFPAYWARDLVGQRRDAVEVTYGGETFYLDDAEAVVPAMPPEYAKALGVPSEPHVRGAGSGWEKVTIGRGSPSYGHAELQVEPGSVLPRAVSGQETT